MSSVVISGDSSGTISLTVPSVAGTNTATLPAATGTVMVSGNMPAFSAYATGTTSIANATATKIIFAGTEFDTTNGMYASSKFTPTVAGYYQINAAWASSAYTAITLCFIYKNGATNRQGTQSGNVANISAGASVSALVYCNGSTDYIEIYAYQQGGGTVNATTNQAGTYFQACLVRTA